MRQIDKSSICRHNSYLSFVHLYSCNHIGKGIKIHYLNNIVASTKMQLLLGIRSFRITSCDALLSQHKSILCALAPQQLRHRGTEQSSSCYHNERERGLLPTREERSTLSVRGEERTLRVHVRESEPGSSTQRPI